MWGVDTLRIGGMVGGCDFDAAGWMVRSETTGDGGSRVLGRLRVLGSGATLSMVPTRTGLTGWVEGSVPKCAAGVNYPAADLDTVAGVAGGWLGEMGEFVRLLEPARVNRLDVVRDFDIGDQVGDVLAGVGMLSYTGRGIRAVYRDRQAGDAQTVWTRTRRSGGGRLYDKGRESGLVEALGVARFEAQERRPSLKAAGVTGVESVTGDVLGELVQKRWQWCGYGEAVIPWERFVAVVQGSGKRWDLRLRLMGWAAAGYPRLPSRATEYRYRKMLREFGHPGRGDVGWQLDLVQGLVAA